MKKIYSLLFAFVGFCFAANAQSQLGEIRGKVLDSKTKKPLDYVSVTIQLNGVTKAAVLTDDDGSYVVKTLQPGTYTILVTNLGYRNVVVSGVDVTSDNITFQNISMEASEGKELEAVVVKAKKALIDPDGVNKTTKTSAEIMRLPQRNANSIANTVAGVDSRSGGTPNIRGARADGTAYYVDGVRVQAGSANIPQNAIDQIQIITGGTPAQYGDFTGGAISINTKSPSKQWMRTFEYITSSPFNSYLDNSNYNEMQMGISGPILLKDKGKSDKERVLLGFTLYGAGVFSRDGRLPATTIYQVNDAKLREIEERPLLPLPGGGFVSAGEYLTRGDLQEVGYRQNAANYRGNLQGNFVYQIAKNASFRLGYQGEYSRGRAFSYANSLTNNDNNQLSRNFNGRVYLQYSQNFSKDASKEDVKKSLISNAQYTVRISYEGSNTESMSAEHGRNIFDYGYVGTFDRYQANFYENVRKGFGEAADVYTLPDGRKLYLSSYAKLAGTFDTALIFRQSDINRIKGNYTRSIYDYYNQTGQRVTSINQIRGLQGITNGDEPPTIYSGLWASPGALQGNYSKSRNESIALFVTSEATIAPRSNPKAKHDLQFGFTAEQQFVRSYGLTANGLWTLMRQLTNTHFQGFDTNTATAVFDANGVFNDTINMQRLIVPGQTNFDKNLRDKLISMGARDVNGKLIDQYSLINTDAYDPGMYAVNMFSANELLNNGNSYVSYFGYDYKGNVVRGRPNLNQFLNDSINRTLGAYQPIYAAAWLQDKFVFKDLIVRIGLRVERFDANQVVLKDPYSLAPVYTAGDVRRGNLLVRPEAIPTSIGDDAVVYVDNVSHVNNLGVSGFRRGNNWFDAQGNPVQDPTQLYKTSVQNGSTINRNTPYLVTANQQIPTAESFRDYNPDVKVLPRIWFSFPISTTSQFFGTYDVLAQRPTQANIAQIDDYFFLNTRLSGVIANPNLRMTQVTDYQIGFKQQVGQDAALQIIASYREFRNLIQLFRYNQAWPFDYTSYGNLDFSTVKSIQLEYELREVGNLSIQANYMLQFADGTDRKSVV